MDIRQMKYFKTIVEEGTISKAAKKLHMAQPPLSMQLKQLEEELGIPKKRIYVAYFPTEDWGWNDSNF